MSDTPRTVTVMLPLPLGKGYTYGVPEEFEIAPGDFVSIPLGQRQVNGVVWDGEPGEVPPEKLKNISDKLDAPPLPRVTRDFVEWLPHIIWPPMVPCCGW